MTEERSSSSEWTPSNDALNSAYRGIVDHRNRRLGDLAVEKGWITSLQIKECLHSDPSKTVEELLQSQNLLSPSQILSLKKELGQKDLHNLDALFSENIPEEVKKVIEVGIVVGESLDWIE